MSQNRAKLLAIATVILCLAIFLISLIPAGFSIYVFDTPGSGLLHELYVWGLFFILALMPIFAVTTGFKAWRAYKLGNYRRVVAWSGGLFILFLCWAQPAWTIYFT